YAAYANGKDLRSLSAIVGEEALGANDRLYLKFADEFERKYVNQGLYEDRTIEDTLGLGWDLISALPEGEMKRVKRDFIEKYGKWKKE
ncbi:MAG: V-type ATP synthase subunit B, partial [Candidatus Thermoplasmatota archaeon]|nr:V-type ATP synthase subunit B [Candidatus Thermoplasmatota archaeon]